MRFHLLAFRRTDVNCAFFSLDRATTLRLSKSIQPLSATPNRLWSRVYGFLASVPIPA